EFCKTPYETVKDCNALIISTEWDQFRDLDKAKLKEIMAEPNIIDGRNVFSPLEMKELGFNYIGVGRGVQ
ncbi:UDP-glucose 6-dehydrogenase, partial [Candidatus Woesearchaeota archaeon]|nr:UDP-glucose 6-dehydrogenase [Candidatus Woesearchaeota archaeon]